MRVLGLLILLGLVSVGTASAQMYCQAPQRLWDDTGAEHSSTGGWCFYLMPDETPATPVPTSTPTRVPPTRTALPDTGQRVVPDQYPTIAAALAGIPVGGTVLVRPGTYNELVTVRTAGVTIQGELGGGQRAWIDGQCDRVHGVYVVADDVTIRGLGVRNTTEAAVLIGSERATARAHIDGNAIENYNCQQTGDQYAAGVAAWYAGPGHRITGNYITRSDRSKGNGIWFKSNAAQASGGGHLITGNTIQGGYDGIGGEEEGSPRGGFDRNTQISGNTVRGCWDDGIQVEGGGLSIVVRDNTIEECGVGIAFATPLTGPLLVENNVIRSSSPGFYNQLACFKAGRASTAVITIQGNSCTLTGATVAHGFQQTNSGAGVWKVTNNQFRVTGYVVETTTVAPAGTTFDYNCYQTSDTEGRLVKWAGTRYNTLEAFRAATGHERNGYMC